MTQETHYHHTYYGAGILNHDKIEFEFCDSRGFMQTYKYTSLKSAKTLLKETGWELDEAYHDKNKAT